MKISIGFGRKSSEDTAVVLQSRNISFNDRLDEILRAAGSRGYGGGRTVEGKSFQKGFCVRKERRSAWG